MMKAELFSIQASVLIISLVAILPLSAAHAEQRIDLTIDNRASLGAEKIVSETDGTTIWNLMMHAINGENSTSIYLELLMEGKNPVYPVMQIISKDGTTKDLSVKPVVPGVVTNNLDDLTPIASQPVSIGNVTAKSVENMWYTVQVLLFKDEGHKVLYEHGHIMTMLYRSLNCYQIENQCLNSLIANSPNFTPSLAWGWQYNKSDQTKPTWTYLTHDQTEFSQNVVAAIKKEETQKPAVSSFQLQNIPSSLAFGDTINIGITGQYKVATAMLFQTDAQSNTQLISVAQSSIRNNTSLFFPIPPKPQGAYQQGDYRLDITVMDKNGNRYSYSFKYAVT